MTSENGNILALPQAVAEEREKQMALDAAANQFMMQQTIRLFIETWRPMGTKDMDLAEECSVTLADECKAAAQGLAMALGICEKVEKEDEEDDSERLCFPGD